MLLCFFCFSFAPESSCYVQIRIFPVFWILGRTWQDFIFLYESWFSVYLLWLISLWHDVVIFTDIVISDSWELWAWRYLFAFFFEFRQLLLCFLWKWLQEMILQFVLLFLVDLLNVFLSSHKIVRIQIIKRVSLSSLICIAWIVFSFFSMAILTRILFPIQSAQSSDLIMSSAAGYQVSSMSQKKYETTKALTKK